MSIWYKKIISILLIILFMIWVFFVEPNMLTITKYQIKNERLKGIKIVFVSDFHIKPHQEKRLKAIIRRINQQEPDIVLSAGDFVNGHELKSTMPIEDIAKYIKQINCPFYTVVGNHDYWIYGDEVASKLVKNGIKVLDNANVLVTIKNKRIYIAGVEDLTTQKPNIDEALGNTKSPTILLTHTPDIFPRVPNTVDLTLAGHLHGGQIRLPLLGALITPSKYRNRYSLGLIEEENRKMIVTKGIGTSIIPVRFNCLPEIVVIEFL